MKKNEQSPISPTEVESRTQAGKIKTTLDTKSGRLPPEVTRHIQYVLFTLLIITGGAFASAPDANARGSQSTLPTATPEPTSTPAPTGTPETPTPTTSVTAEISDAGGSLSTGTGETLAAGQIKVEIEPRVFSGPTQITAIEAAGGLNLTIDCSRNCPETAKITITLGVTDEPIDPSIDVTIGETVTNFPAIFNPDTRTISSQVTLNFPSAQLAALRSGKTSSTFTFEIRLRSNSPTSTSLTFLPIVLKSTADGKEQVVGATLPADHPLVQLIHNNN
jgi:hypothetical protein